ncbi:response regulator transcription factor, partial [Olsenella sp. CU969]|uniref:response regulator transcription factor n=1 Tax=Olsenella sp. CU969 TaxID=2780101 RepID=UPI00195A564D
AEAALEGLTDRERSVLALVAEGLDNREVAGRLYLSEGTVRNHVSAILRKKELRNRAQLVSLYYRGPVIAP